MSQFFSPGVYVTESDKSDYAPPEATTILGLVGVAQRGPLHKPLLITTEEELVSVFGAPPKLSNGANTQYVVEVRQTTGSVSGNFTLSFGGQTTANIAFGAAASAVTSALEALSSIGAGKVVASGATGGPWTITFISTLGGRILSALTGSGSGLTNATLAVNRVTQGSTAPSDYGMHAALNFLRVGRRLYFTRTCQNIAGVWQATSASTPATASDSGAIQWDATGSAERALLATAVTPGEWGNDLKLQFTKLGGDVNEKQTVTLVNAAGGSFTLTFGGQTTASIAYDAAASVVQSRLEALSSIGAGNVAVTGTAPAWTIEFKNALGFTDVALLTSAAGSLTGSTPTITHAVIQTPNYGYDVYRMDVIAPIDNAGQTAVVESFDRVMLVNDPLALASYNAYFLGDVVNKGVRNAFPASLYVSFDSTLFPLSASLVKKQLASITTPVVYSFSGGFSAMNAMAGTAGDATASYVGTQVDATYNGPTALQVYANKDAIPVNMLALPGVTDNASLTALVLLCETRKDCMAIIDTPRGLNVTQATNWHNRADVYASTGYKPNSSYGAIYWPWGKVQDAYNREVVTLPPTCFVPARYAYSAYTDSPFAAPAGLKRGRLPEILQLETNSTPSRGQLDAMYSGGNCINPIIDFLIDGPTVYGQRTTQRRPTKLDRVAPRLMMMYAERLVAHAVRILVFDPNDGISQGEFLAYTNPILENIRRSRGLEAFMVICDASINDATVRNNNQMKGRVLLIPQGTAEAISVEFVVLPSGASFNSAA